MWQLLKRVFGSKIVETSAAPYKVEAAVTKVDEFPFPETNPVKSEKKTADKKPAAKAKTPRKPRVPKTPK